MTLQDLVKDLPATGAEVSLEHIPEESLPEVGKNVITLMNVSGVMTKHGTHYNTPEEAEAAMEAAHEAVFRVDRGIYLLIHALDGVTDYSMQKAITAMLQNPWAKFGKSILSSEQEMQGILYISDKLPANRRLNLFGDLRKLRVNNSRTKRQLILPSLLGNKNFPFWAVKYRGKVRKALEHAWGHRKTSIIGSILQKVDFTMSDIDASDNPLERAQRALNFKEISILSDHIGKYAAPRGEDFFINVMENYQAVAFALGISARYTVPILKAFEEAKTDLSKGKSLPREVLEGIRSMYHQDIDQKAMLELTKGAMTSKARLHTQVKSKELGVDVEFDPMTANTVDLYKLAYEDGMANEVWRALQIKAKKAAEQVPIRFNSVGILVDTSFSMIGAKEQKLRPMAIALSMRDVLANLGEKDVIVTSGNRGFSRMPRPSGSTSLASGLLSLLEAEVDAVFIISDGYENAPAGRLNEVMHAVRRIGNTTPVYHVNPVMGAEAKTGVRELSDLIPVLPVSNPQSLGLTLFRAAMEVDVKRGIQALVSMALPLIENGYRGRREIENHG